ncbi:hypothetical protein KGM_207715 [Danaus plexippus plexippus]|uniref:Uncharacterized protein n=1 Tax=Danaus plexippus plexippus TaxID=278856 RepID=A0A212FHX9_DANPL|nr:hypothetical protein KGM_207715 [Danaus plexippus plexippus]
MSETVIKNCTGSYMTMTSELNIKSELGDSCRNDQSNDKNDNDKCGVKEEDDGKMVNQRENRLTTIIDQLRCQSKLKVKQDLRQSLIFNLLFSAICIKIAKDIVINVEPYIY